MSIVHDAYPFHARDFLESTAPYLSSPGVTGAAYRALRKAAIDVYDGTPEVRQICSEYGGWDRSSIFDGIPADTPRNERDTVFWLSVFLYRSFLERKPHALGIGGNLALVETLLDEFGWVEPDKELLISGRSFGELAHRTNFPRWGAGPISSEVDGLLSELKPLSTGSRAGWLSQEDVSHLHGRLTLAYSEAEEMGRVRWQASEKSRVAFHTLIGMLSRADTLEAELCVIASG